MSETIRPLNIALAEIQASLSPQRGEGLRVRGGNASRFDGPMLDIGVSGIPTPHPAFGHLLPVEGRRENYLPASTNLKQPKVRSYFGNNTAR